MNKQISLSNLNDELSQVRTKKKEIPILFCIAFALFNSKRYVKISTSYNNTPFWFYEVYPSEDISGYHFKLIKKEHDKIFFRLAWMKADYFPEEVLSALVDWTC